MRIIKTKDYDFFKFFIVFYHIFIIVFFSRFSDCISAQGNGLDRDNERYFCIINFVVVVVVVVVFSIYIGTKGLKRKMP